MAGLDPSSTRASAVLVAAGSSTRMAAEVDPPEERKPWLELGGRTLLDHVCAVFQQVPAVVEVVLVAHRDDLERVARWRAERPAFDKVRAVVPGGATRSESVRRGARATSELDLVAVHDVARPLVRREAIEATLAVAARDGSALLAAPVQDTLKFSVEGDHADRTVPRANLWLAQTPQCFERRRFLELLARAEADGLEPTDDSALWEHYVGPVTLVEGSSTNLKITTPADLEIAKGLLAARDREAWSGS